MTELELADELESLRGKDTDTLGRWLFGNRATILAALRRVAEPAGVARLEEAAQRIFEHWAFGRWEPGEKAAWVPRGNSDMQELARAFARAALEDTPDASN